MKNVILCCLNGCHLYSASTFCTKVLVPGGYISKAFHYDF